MFVLKFFKIKLFFFDNVNLEILFLFGKLLIYFFEEILCVIIGEFVYFFLDFGYVCLCDDRCYIFFKNGLFGSVYIYSDNNSVCFYDKKKFIFIDVGRYIYKEE